MKALQFRRNLPRYAAARMAGSLTPGRGAAAGPLKLVDLDEPQTPGPDWGRVRPRLSGSCGSDLATVDGRSARYFEPLVSFPFIPGHEVVGDLDDARRQTLVDRLIKITAARGKPRVTVDGKTTKVILPTQRFLQDVVDGVDFGKVGDVDEVERTLTVTVSSDSQEGTPED